MSATAAASTNHRSLIRRPGGRADRPAVRAGASGCGQPGRGLAAGALPRLVDPVDERQQLLGLLEVDGPLHLGRLLGGLPAGLRDVGVLLEVLGLEVVAPQHVDVVLGQLGALLLDDEAAGAEHVVGRRVVLLDDAVARLRLDACLDRVVDAAGDVAVGMRGPSGRQRASQIHGSTPHRR